MWDFFSYLGVLVFLYYLIYIILICIPDCDLGLAYAEKFGTPIEALKNKVIWITGSSSGIGKHLALQCAEIGSKLVLTARREDLLNDVKKECIARGAKPENVFIFPINLLDMEAHQQMFDEVIKHFGQLDILVNNAGRSQRAAWEDIDLKVDRQLFELDVFSVVSLSRIAVRYFRKRGSGHVAATSSVAGLVGIPFSGSYTGAKHAVHGYLNSLRSETMGTGIDITLFCPGPIFTGYLEEAFTDKEGEKYGIAVAPTDKRMTAERCGQLFAIALANKINTTWACLFPMSLFVYATLYFPNLYSRIMGLVGTKRFKKLRDGT